MSKEWIMKTLTAQGLPRIDADIYVYLITEGPNDRKQIGQALNLTRCEISRSLTHLKDIGIITEIPERPVMFSALSFDRVLELFLESKKEQTRDLQETKEKLVSSWQAMLHRNNQTLK